MTEETFSDAAGRKALRNELRAVNIAVHQPDDPPLFTPEPRSTMVPWHWRATDISRSLDRIGEALKLEAGGVRRTLRLANPGLEFGTTPTFWASVQYILPGEIATAHRHAASALRFIMKGQGADTIVDGERYEFGELDLVLTPAGAFHDHEHKGTEPMVWLDVLDISLVRKLDAVFFEGSDVARRPVHPHPDASYREFGSGIMRPTRPVHAHFDNPLLVYPWARAEAAVLNAGGLDPDLWDDTVMEYCNPRTGGPALPTIGTRLQRLRPGIMLASQRHTGSSVYYVIRGEGRSTIAGHSFDWSAGDFFAVPPWASYAHSNRSAQNDAMLFQVNDFPALKALGLWREQREGG